MLENKGQVLLRNGNAEAFRCLLMFLTVAYHSFIYGPYSLSRAHDDVAAVLDRSGFECIWILCKMSGGKFVQNLECIKWILHCPFLWMRLKRNSTAALGEEGYLSLRQKAMAFGKRLRAGEIVNGLG